MDNTKKKNTETVIKVLSNLGKILWFIIKIPYFIVLGIYKLVKYFSAKKMTKSKIKPVFQDFEVVKTEKGDYNKWVDEVFTSDSKIGIILGSRGSGKTAFGVRFLENAYSKSKKKGYAIGFNKEEMPSFIKIVTEVNEIENNSLVLIDEGGVLFSSRNSMTAANKLLSSLMLISRHKNISILFISQNSSNLEINILRQADFLVFKNSSLLQKEFERKIIQKIYEKINPDFEKFENKKKMSYVYSDEFKGFISNSLPSFWGTNISKSFR